jgi:hypothetical protein
MRVLLTGIDTLVLGYYCELDADFLQLLETEWEHRKAAHQELHVELGGLVHQAGRVGGAYKWALVRPDTWAVRIAERKPNDKAPHVSIQFRSAYLWERGPAGAVQDALEALWPDIGKAPTKCIVSRADLCADWMGWSIEPEQASHFVRRVHAFAAHWEPRRRELEVMRRHGEDSVASLVRDGWPADNAAELVTSACLNALRGAARTRFEDALWESDAEKSESLWWRGQTFTGFTFGRGSVGGRVYRKDCEISDVSGKRWFYDLWSLIESDPIARRRFLVELEDDTPVWRLEYQLRRPALMEFREPGAKDSGISSFEDLLTHASQLWTYLAGAWLRLAVPTKTRTGNLDKRERWPTHENWGVLRDCRWRPRAESLLRERRLSINRERSVVSGVRAASRVIATHPHAGPLEGLSLRAALELFEREAKEILPGRELTWPGLVADARELARSPQRTDAAFPGLVGAG